MRSLLIGVVLAAMTAACGDDGGLNQLPDAPLFPDAPIDAPTTGLVSLTITQDGLPRAGVRVYFQNPDSTLVSSMLTDSNGFASAVMGIGGFVTAIDAFAIPQGGGGQHELHTFSGVKPLDQLKLSQGSNAQTINFNLAFTPDPNSGRFVLYAPCAEFGIDVTNNNGSGSGSGGPGGPMSLTGCGTTTDVTIVGFESKSNVPHRALHAKNVTLTEEGTLDLTDTTAFPFTDSQSLLFNYEGVPAEIFSVNAQQFLATARGPVYEQSGLSVATKAGTASMTGTRPTIADALQIVSTSTFAGSHSRQNTIDWGPQTSPYTLVMGNILNPTILLQNYAAEPTFSEVTHSVTWTVEDSGRLPDFATTNTSFNRSKVQSWNWSIAAPLSAAAATTVTYPVLPAADAQFNPVEGDNPFVSSLTTAKVPGGYDSVRATVHSVDSDNPNGIVVGAAGIAVVQELQFNKGKGLRDPVARQHLLHPFARVKTRR